MNPLGLIFDPQSDAPENGVGWVCSLYVQNVPLSTLQSIFQANRRDRWKFKGWNVLSHCQEKIPSKKINNHNHNTTTTSSNSNSNNNNKKKQKTAHHQTPSFPKLQVPTALQMRPTKAKPELQLAQWLSTFRDGRLGRLVSWGGKTIQAAPGMFTPENPEKSSDT